VAKHVSELICWQLARELQQETFTLTARASFNGNFGLRDRLREAGSSAPSNISEEFARLTHREFHRFLEVARSSGNEIEARRALSQHRTSGTPHLSHLSHPI